MELDIEHLAPQGTGSPLHVHQHVIEPAGFEGFLRAMSQPAAPCSTPQAASGPR